MILRYEIERALIEGEIECEDIPALWHAKMTELLGLSTEGNFNNGCMQDVHWSAGLFGYFPCYTLGAMYAAQWFATMRREMPDLDERIARGDLAPVFELAQGQGVEPGQPLEHAGAGAAGQRRAAEPGALPVRTWKRATSDQRIVTPTAVRPGRSASSSGTKGASSR